MATFIVVSALSILVITYTYLWVIKGTSILILSARVPCVSLLRVIVVFVFFIHCIHGVLAVQLKGCTKTRIKLIKPAN